MSAPERLALFGHFLMFGCLPVLLQSRPSLHVHTGPVSVSMAR
jgi:hypothetical protein